MVTEYLKSAGLIDPLAQLGFNVVGYGCTTCIGNSGPLPGEVAKAVTGSDLVAAAVISGNRNFEGRVHPLVKANFLASPPLVVAYALAGTVDIDLDREPLGMGKDGPVFLKDIWPTSAEIAAAITAHVRTEMFTTSMPASLKARTCGRPSRWRRASCIQWDEASTYIHHPPYFQSLELDVPHVSDIEGAGSWRCMGDSITTDHISPAGNIAADSPAGKFLQERGVHPETLTVWREARQRSGDGARDFRQHPPEEPAGRAQGRQSGPRHMPGGEEMCIYDAAMKYQGEGVPAIILAGKEYGTGSSRDWAAKGPMLQGVRAVIAESFERIHRSNLVGMGVLPLRYVDGQNAESLGLKGDEVFSIVGLDDNLRPQSLVSVKAESPDGMVVEFKAQALLNTPVEVNYYRNGGILHTVLRNLMK